MGNMTKIQIILWTTLFTAMLVSCSNPGGNPILILNDDLPPLEKNEFYAQNIETGKYYKVKAEILHSTSKCVIWAEKGSGITRAEAKEIADVYDTKIRECVVNAFSKKNFDFTYEKSKRYFNDMLDFANWLVYGDSGDKKLTILLLDIKDGYKPPKIESYVAGYFFGGNFYPEGKIKGTVHYSNGRDMIYVDTNPGLKEAREQAYATFAHELQHLINFVTTVLQRDHYMDTWIDEGLSSQAEYLYLGKNPPTRYQWFINDDYGTIARGNNFFVWDNHHEEPNAILDDYATVYLFFRWLYLQAQNKGLQSHIFLDIEDSNSYDYQAVTDAAGNIDPTWNNWEILLRTWFFANYSPTDSTYGYIDDNVLKENINITKKLIEEKKISLYPGEGVYSKISRFFSPTGNSGINIHYAGLDANATINTSSPYTGGVLLTFNANTKNTGPHEPGYLTGVPLPKSQTMARNIQTETISGPYVIDARDLLERYKR